MQSLRFRSAPGVGGRSAGRYTSCATVAAAEPGLVAAICAVAWALPGAGHLWLGRASKGIVFLVALPVMFAIGLGLDGELFAIDPSQPLVALA